MRSGVGGKFSWTEGNGDGIGNGIGGGIGGGGAREGAVLEAWPVDAGLDADVFLGAEDGFVSRALGGCTPERAVEGRFHELVQLLPRQTTHELLINFEAERVMALSSCLS